MDGTEYPLWSTCLQGQALLPLETHLLSPLLRLLPFPGTGTLGLGFLWVSELRHLPQEVA